MKPDHEKELMDLFENKSKGVFKGNNTGIFIDIGANIGQWSILMSRVYTFVAVFEPCKRAAAELENRIKDLHIKNIIQYDVALGDKRVKKKFYEYERTEHSTFLKDNYYNERNFKALNDDAPFVCIRTLDSFNFRNVAAIKIDTEGYEVEVIKGAKKTILKFKPKILIEIHDDKNINKIKKILPEIKFETVIYKGAKYLYYATN